MDFVNSLMNIPLLSFLARLKLPIILKNYFFLASFCLILVYHCAVQCLTFLIYCLERQVFYYCYKSLRIAHELTLQYLFLFVSLSPRNLQGRPRTPLCQAFNKHRTVLVDDCRGMVTKRQVRDCILFSGQVVSWGDCKILSGKRLRHNFVECYMCSAFLSSLSQGNGRNRNGKKARKSRTCNFLSFLPLLKQV